MATDRANIPSFQPSSGTGELHPPSARLVHLQPPILARFVPFAALACFLAWCFISLHSDFAWDDAEPEILNQAWRMTNGQSIYHGIDAPPYTFAAYPPIYFALSAALLKFTGLSYLPSKLLSFLAALSLGWAFIRLSREWNKSARAGLWAAFFLFLIPAFLYNSVRCHVQMLAVAFSIWSLVFFLRNRWKETLIISPIFAVLAFYTKQTQIALPLAMAIYLAFQNRRWFLPYVSILIAIGLVPYLWLQKITGGFFFFDIVRMAQIAYNPWDIPKIFLHHAGPVLIFIGIALSILWRRFKKQSWEAIDFYLAIVFIITLVSLGRLGAHGQYVMEFLIVTLLYLLKTAGLPTMPSRRTLVSIQIFLLLLYAPAFIILEEGLWDISANRAAPKIYSLLKNRQGPVLSQQGSFALFSRGEIYIQLFHFSGLSRAKMWDQKPFLKSIEKQSFCCVITEFPIEDPVLSETDRERFTPEILASVRKNYRLLESVYPYFFYVPASGSLPDKQN
jgi:hypothetical protein